MPESSTKDTKYIPKSDITKIVTLDNKRINASTDLMMKIKTGDSTTQEGTIRSLDHTAIEFIISMIKFHTVATSQKSVSQ